MTLHSHRSHYETQARDALGRFEQAPRFEFLNRYYSDPAFKAQIDAEQEAGQRRHLAKWDAEQVRQFARKDRDDEPGFVHALRARVVQYARAEKDHALLIHAGISETEADEIVADLIEEGVR
jgi:hypothetical protein